MPWMLLWHPVEISIDDTIFDVTTEVYALASSAALGTHSTG
jgi:hypothetical protein